MARELAFDAGLDVVGELASVCAEDLDAVVGPGVVARRHDRSAGECRSCARYAIAGVGSTSSKTAAAPSIARPRAKSFSMRAPDCTRVATDQERGAAGQRARATARPNATTSGVVRSAVGVATDAVGAEPQHSPAPDA